MSDALPSIRPQSLALWGTAHLAWGVMIVAGLVVAAQEMPVESTPRLERAALFVYFAGLSYLALLGWLQVDRGWKLRRPAIGTVIFPLIDLPGNLALVILGTIVWLRGVESRALASGLDRLLVAILIASGISAALGAIVWLRSGRKKPPATAPRDRRLALAVLLAQTLWALSLLLLESLAW